MGGRGGDNIPTYTHLCISTHTHSYPSLLLAVWCCGGVVGVSVLQKKICSFVKNDVMGIGILILFLVLTVV